MTDAAMESAKLKLKLKRESERKTKMKNSPTPPPPPSAATATNTTANAANGKRFKMVFKKPDTEVGHRVLIYGKPGCGKTTMMLKGLPRPLVAFDFDNSINILLAKPKEESGIDPTDIYLADVPRDAENRIDYGAFLSILRDAENFEGVKSVLIDTGTFAENAIEPYMFEHPDKFPTGNTDKTTGKVKKAISLADYSFRSGNIYKLDLYKVMLSFLENLALSKHIHVGLIYHTAVGKVPNLESPDGFALQYQPDSWVQGKTSLAETAMGWCDHVGYIKADSVMDTIKQGQGQKAIEKKVERYTGDCVISFVSTGDHIGKSRTLYGDAATVPLADFNLGMLGIK